ncbi:MAG: ABC transporter permease [Blastopirellula sp. JB062]
MTLRSIIWNELRSRPSTVISNSLAILLGVAALVAIRHVTVHSEKEISDQLTSLGANILILPQEATLQNYYAADQNGGTLPEEHVADIYLAGLPGIEQVSPRLNATVDVDDAAITLTGILPQSEVAALSKWQTTMLTAPVAASCCQKASVGGGSNLESPDALVQYRAIENLQEDQVVLGADVAERIKRSPGQKLEMLGEKFTVLGVLPPTGTIDDSRAFTHLHTVQRLTDSGAICNAIEVIGCCEDAAGNLVPELQQLLPNAKVVTISQVVQTQVGVNRLMANTSWIILGVMIVVGGAGLAGAIAANVRERRREIGTLLALGATPAKIQKLFLGKALVLGVCAGTLGSATGLIAAVIAGPAWAGVSITPLLGTSSLAIACATLVALLAAWWPARQAAQLDPCLCFKEV